jgi:hypothetical protein
MKPRKMSATSNGGMSVTPSFRSMKKRQKLQQPEIGDDDELSDQSLVLLTEELVEAKTR